MTLVVSEVSKFGITMVGDSAVTIREPLVKVVGGASKVRHSSVHNVGFAIWGHATVDGVQLDRWLDEFINNQLDDDDDMDTIGDKLAENLVEELRRENKPWAELVLGIHIAGYKAGLPRLWHIHCGCFNGQPYSVPPHEPRLFKDYPENQGWSDSEYEALLNSGNAYQFRNGHYELFSLLFAHIEPLLKAYRERFKIELPRANLDGRLAYYRMLVRFVADVLVAADERPGVNDELSWISLTEKGLTADGTVRITNWLGDRKGDACNALWL